MLLIVECRADVIFVLDESGSIGRDDFNSLKEFASDLAAALDIDSGDTRLGLVAFDTRVGEYFDLNTYSSLAAVQTAIAALSYNGGGTRTDRALKYVRESMLTQAAGERNTVPNVVVLFTDGQSSRPSRTEVSGLHTGVILVLPKYSFSSRVVLKIQLRTVFV